MRIFYKSLPALFLLTALNAQALECHLNDSDGITEESEDIGQLAIPTNLPVGSILWKSDVMTRAVFCWSRLSKGESVYFYSDPDSASAENGLEFGIIYNGNDLGTSPNRTITNILITKSGVKNGVLGVVNYQLYLKKTGDISEDYNGIPQFAVFQLDGEKGINIKPGLNYRYTVTGLDNIRVIPCGLEIPEVTDVDFGTLPPWDGKGHDIAHQTFSLHLKKSCGAPFSVDARFTSSLPLVDDSSLDLQNGASLKLYDVDSGHYIHYGHLTPMANMTTTLTHVKTYRAELIANGKSIAGPFSADVVISVNYK